MQTETFTAEIQQADGRRAFIHNACAVVAVPGYLRVDVRHDAQPDLGVPAFTAEHWFTGAVHLGNHSA